MKYWIIVDDRHAGPFTATQLLETGLTPDTLVWTEGMPDWTRAANVTELAEGLRRRAIAEAEARERLVAESDAANARLADVGQQPHAENPRGLEEPAASAPEHAEVSETVEEIIETAQPARQADDYATRQFSGNPQPGMTRRPEAAAVTAEREPCPPAYIAWSIIATLLCCTIVGIPAIIFASMTKSAYYKGDVAKARRYSDITQWLIIAAITLGAISWPFQMAFMSMMP